MPVGKLLSAIVVVVAICVFVGALLIWKPEIDPVETPTARAFNSALVKKGAELAATAVYAIMQRTAERLLRPVANPCFGVRRDIA